MTQPKMVKWDDKWLATRGSYYTTVTPELATKLLERNTNNRPPKQRSIKQYARDMQAERWDPDASDIKFAHTGELIDGQNRLIASMVSGASFPTLVRTGLNPEAKRHVDTGVKRTAADMLKMQGIKGSTTGIAAAVTLRDRYLDRVENHAGKRASDARTTVTLTHDEILDHLDKHPAILEFAVEADAMRRVVPAFPVSSILAFLSLAAETEDGNKLAHEFVHRIVSGDYGGPGDPIQALVQYAAIARARQTGSPGYQGRYAQESHLLALTRAWNAWRKGEKIGNRITVKTNHRLVLPE